MGDFPHYFDIILFAMIAGFLILRLRSVLGRRTGNERRRNPLIRPVEQKLPTFDRWAGARPATTAETTPPMVPPGDAVAAGLARIRMADGEFDPERFLAGAQIAFNTIVAAFAAGDKTKLRPLLSDEVYRPFCAAIDERNAQHETLETRVLGLKQLDFLQAELSGRTARIALKIVSDQINLVRASGGSILDGDPDHAIEKTDFWTFARDTRATDPNWVLVATDSG